MLVYMSRNQNALLLRISEYFFVFFLRKWNMKARKKNTNLTEYEFKNWITCVLFLLLLQQNINKAKKNSKRNMIFFFFLNSSYAPTTSIASKNHNHKPQVIIFPKIMARQKKTVKKEIKIKRKWCENRSCSMTSFFWLFFYFFFKFFLQTDVVCSCSDVLLLNCNKKKLKHFLNKIKCILLQYMMHI